MRFRKEFLEGMLTNFVGVLSDSVSELTGGLNVDGEVDPARALVLFDLLDACDVSNVNLESEVLDRTLAVIREQRENHISEWKKMIGSSVRKRDWNRHLVRHFDNSWNIKPVEVAVIGSDSKVVEVNSVHYKNILLKVEILKLMRDCGISSWEKFIPQDTQEGTYARLLVDSLNS